jgi:hypothetical protein
MMAEVMVSAESYAMANRIAADFLKREGWIGQLEHFEQLAEAPVHDSRLGSLFRAAQRKGLASELSPYN